MRCEENNQGIELTGVAVLTASKTLCPILFLLSTNAKRLNQRVEAARLLNRLKQKFREQRQAPPRLGAPQSWERRRATAEEGGSGPSDALHMLGKQNVCASAKPFKNLLQEKGCQVSFLSWGDGEECEPRTVRACCSTRDYGYNAGFRLGARQVALCSLVGHQSAPSGLGNDVGARPHRTAARCCRREQEPPPPSVAPRSTERRHEAAVVG